MGVKLELFGNQPMRSTTTWVSVEPAMQTSPPVPMPVRTALGIVSPAVKFRFEVAGVVPPQG